MLWVDARRVKEINAGGKTRQDDYGRPSGWAVSADEWSDQRRNAFWMRSAASIHRSIVGTRANLT